MVMVASVFIALHVIWGQLQEGGSPFSDPPPPPRPKNPLPSFKHSPAHDTYPKVISSSWGWLWGMYVGIPADPPPDPSPGPFWALDI